MKIQLFQSSHGDCLLLEGNDRTRMLVDGGIKGSFRRHALRTLARGAPIDLLCISHVDQDHIGGILAYLDNLVKWRVFRHRRSQGRRVRPPSEPELPEIGEIWHNAFHDTVEENRGRIERFLAQSGEILSGHGEQSMRDLGARYTDLAQSVGEGIEVSRRIADEQLGIPLNELWNGKLIRRSRGPDPIFLGDLTINVLGPTKKDLDELKDFWNDWMSDREAQMERLRRRMNRDDESLAQFGGSLILEASRQFAEEFALSGLGNRSQVSEPNLASIMLHVEDADGRTILLTGDGHMDDVEGGLEKAGLLGRDEGLHVDVLKIAHHGSENNSKPENYQRITADHYVFCGNGHSHNPDTRIVDAVIDSRIGPRNLRSGNRETDNRFKLWFNTNPDDPDNRHAEHMRTVRTRVRSRAARSNRRMRFSFQSASVRTLNI